MGGRGWGEGCGWFAAVDADQRSPTDRLLSAKSGQPPNGRCSRST